MNLEDETGMINVIISTGRLHRTKPIPLSSRAITVRGIVQTGQGTVSLVANQLTPLDLKTGVKPQKFGSSTRSVGG